jgi:hypothetical protein
MAVTEAATGLRLAPSMYRPTVDASGPLEAGGTFSGLACITSQWEFSAAEQGAMNDAIDAIRRVRF